jgi:hypothetical protein
MERKEILVVALVGIMLLTVGLQTVQLVGLTQAPVVASASSSAQISSASGSSATPSVPTNLQDIPTMVGGC